MSKPKIVDIEQKDLNSLLTRVSASNLEDSDKKRFLNIVQCYVWFQASLQEAKMSIAGSVIGSVKNQVVLYLVLQIRAAITSNDWRRF